MLDTGGQGTGMLATTVVSEVGVAPRKPFKVFRSVYMSAYIQKLLNHPHGKLLIH
jgi:hypothetical protein